MAMPDSAGPLEARHAYGEAMCSLTDALRLVEKAAAELQNAAALGHTLTETQARVMHIAACRVGFCTRAVQDAVNHVRG